MTVDNRKQRLTREWLIDVTSEDKNGYASENARRTCQTRSGHRQRLIVVFLSVAKSVPNTNPMRPRFARFSIVKSDMEQR